MDIYKDQSKPTADRVEDLLQRMTLSEKVGQLNQVPMQQHRVEQLEGEIRRGMVGSLILATTAHAGNEVQTVADIPSRDKCLKISIEESRLGIPVILGQDVIHGKNTIFPIPLAQAASWDAPLVVDICTAAAKEAATEAIHWTFAPMLDIARDPRWGRIAESFGEDPYLASVMAEASVHGFQGENLSDYGSIAACAKHYIGYGAAEGGRDYNTVEISKNTLLNIYLPSFRAAVEAGAASVMTAFHENGGVPVTADGDLVNGLLKRELGFDGFVVSDWDAVSQLIHQGIADTKEEASVIALSAGVDMDMLSEFYLYSLGSAVEKNPALEVEIDEAVRRVLKVKFDLGLFEDPYSHRRENVDCILCEDHRKLARRAASASCVLLENKGNLLPLTASAQKVVLVGPMSGEKGAHLGTWAQDGNEDDVVSIAEAVKEYDHSAQIYIGGMADVSLGCVRDADVVIVALGEDKTRTGEARSVADIVLPDGQVELLERIRRLGKKIVTLVCAGRPLAIERVVELSDAVVYCWHSGIEAGHGIADLLFGACSPTGRLPVTLPRCTGQIPIYYNHKPCGRDIDEYYGIVKYRNYEDISGAPLYPFGYGISYSEVSYADPTAVYSHAGLEASVRVTNIGAATTAPVVQCYMERRSKLITMPRRELAAYLRVTLNPGESKVVKFFVPAKALRFYNAQNCISSELSIVNVHMGANCLDTVAVAP